MTSKPDTDLESPPSGTVPPGVHLTGVVCRCIYQSPDQFYTVAELETRGDSRTVVVAGNLGGCEEGDTVEVQGVWADHPRFGRRLSVRTARWVPPVTVSGMKRFLAGGSVPGIGPRLAERIVDHFGEQTVRVLDEEPGRLSEVDGIGAGRAGSLAEAWGTCRARFEEQAFLAGLGLGPTLTRRVLESLGEDAPRRVRENPYLLTATVEGIGFRRADDIARSLEIPADAPQRIGAGLGQVLTQGTEDGHLYTVREELVRRAAALLGLAAGPVEDVLAEELSRGRLVSESLPDGDAIYLPRLFRAEQEVAEDLRTRAVPLRAEERFDGAEALRWVEPRLGLTLTPDQHEALQLLFGTRIGILTGGPGVGKTTIVRGLAEVFLARGLRLFQAAPTGRAARRLEEASGHPASTLHRLLKFQPRLRRFEHNRNNPLEVDVLLVDEASMIDLPLMRDLLRALPPEARLLLVGDADQLPSVGPGDVLRSLVESTAVPVARLHRILRQQEGSSIVRAAHQVLAGEEPGFQTDPEEGAFFVMREDPLAAQQAVLQLVQERLPGRFGLDPVKDIQVLAPMHKGPLGTVALNRQLKEALRPSDEDTLTPGDRVLQTRNNYDLGVFNGEIGFVIGRQDDGHVEVAFEDRRLKYPPAAQADLSLAYAISVHKSQGCEFPAVVLVLAMQHFVLLKRNLLYTAITRARRVLVVVGARRALHAAVQAGFVEPRRSRLAERIQAAPAAEGNHP